MNWLLIVIEIVAAVVLLALLRYSYKWNTLARVRARLARERKAELLGLQRRRVLAEKSDADSWNAERCLQEAGGPLDLMADYDVNHPYWDIAVRDDD